LLEGLDKLKQECEVLFGGDKNFQPIDADLQKSSFVQPALLFCKDGLSAKYVHDVEVFGPVATLVAYDGLDDLIAIARRGLGSLVASVFSNDASFTREAILGIGDLHGRVLAVNSAVGTQHTGHGNVVPSCLHGGPGRLEEARNLPACAPYFFTIADLSCRDRSMASPNWQKCALTPPSCIHNCRLLPRI